MLDMLPTELALQILQTAATELRFTDRQSVVNLASTSNAVYNIVAPILYHTMIVTAKTRDLIAAFTRDESTQAAAKRVCSHVRMVLEDTGSARSINPKLLLNVVTVLAVANFARDLAEAQCQMVAAPTTGPQLRKITLNCIDLKESISWIPQRSRALITHVAGFLPIFVRTDDWNMFFSPSGKPAHGPERWTRSIIDDLPALTHFAFILAAENEEYEATDAFELGVLGRALETALSVSRLKQVVLKVCGRYVERRREEIELILDRILEPRLSVAWEERPLTSWYEYDNWSREEVVAGRSIWTQAVPVFAAS